jgi:glycosyltransferase involved in cell wall biosynthesis
MTIFLSPITGRKPKNEFVFLVLHIMKIAVDCRHINSSGIGVYLRECLPFFFVSPHRFLLLGDPHELQFAADTANVEIGNCSIKPFSLRDTFVFPTQLRKKINSCDIFYSPYFNIPSGIHIPVYITIHDIIFSDMPGLVSKTGLFVRMWFYRRSYHKSRKIFTVSEFSKSRIEYHLGTAKPVNVTYSAIRPMFIQYQAINKIKKKNETLIFIGNIKKHKGLDCLLDAFLLAKQDGLPHTLVIVGSKENFRSRDNSITKKINLLNSTDIIFTGFLKDDELLEHISSAALLIQPSLYEGFGLPPLEALVLGTQVLLSDIPALKEIYNGFPVTFFNAGDTVDLKNKIMKILYKKKPEKIALSDALLSRYTFEKTASAILWELEHTGTGMEKKS